MKLTRDRRRKARDETTCEEPEGREETETLYPVFFSPSVQQEEGREKEREREEKVCSLSGEFLPPLSSLGEREKKVRERERRNFLPLLSVTLSLFRNGQEEIAPSMGIKRSSNMKSKERKRERERGERGREGGRSFLERRGRRNSPEEKSQQGITSTGSILFLSIFSLLKFRRREKKMREKEGRREDGRKARKKEKK